MTISSDEVRDEFKAAQAPAQRESGQSGGGPGPSDQNAAGGSSGSGGYGADEDRQMTRASDAADDDIAADQAAHQDQGQGYIASDGETDTGADPGRAP